MGKGSDTEFGDDDRDAGEKMNTMGGWCYYQAALMRALRRRPRLSALCKSSIWDAALSTPTIMASVFLDSRSLCAVGGLLSRAGPQSQKWSDQQITPDPTGSIHKKAREKKFDPKKIDFDEGVLIWKKRPFYPQKGTLGTQIGTRKVIFGHIAFFLIFWPRF